METLYRRPLPDDAIAFSSAEGRRVFAEALAAGVRGSRHPAFADGLPSPHRERIEATIATLDANEPLRAEIENLRAQIAAVAARPSTTPRAYIEVSPSA